ncbi:hypothetical protein Tco_1309997 [Tanacetum coccineum]
MERGTPVMFAGFQANTSKISFSKLHSSIRPFSDRLSPIMTVSSGYSGWIATLTPSVTAGSLGERTSCASVTNLHSASIMVLLRIVTIPPFIGNFSIPLLKQCSYNTSEANPPSMYKQWMRWPSTSASITIVVSCLLLSPSDEKEISWSVEKLWAVFCLVICCQGWTMKIDVAFSLLGASPFFAAFACSPRFPPCFISLTRFSAGPVIGGGALNFTVSIARISFGVFVRVVNGFWGEFVELNPGGANACGIEHVAPGIRPAAFAVGGVPFFFDFLLTFARTRNVASNEFPNVLLLWLGFRDYGTPFSIRYAMSLGVILSQPRGFDCSAFHKFPEAYPQETPIIDVGCLLTPLAGCVPDRRIGGSVGWICRLAHFFLRFLGRGCVGSHGWRQLASVAIGRVGHGVSFILLSSGKQGGCCEVNVDDAITFCSVVTWSWVVVCRGVVRNCVRDLLRNYGVLCRAAELVSLVGLQNLHSLPGLCSLRSGGTYVPCRSWAFLVGLDRLFVACYWNGFTELLLVPVSGGVITWET